MRNVMLLAMVAFVLLSACKKDEPNINPEKVYPDYACLKVGNYWVYERFRVDTLGEATSLNKFDSCYVEKDTLIHGETYAKLVKRHPHLSEVVFEYLRDSLHYIVNPAGKIKFSSEDFTTIFLTQASLGPHEDTLFVATVKMDDINQRTIVPAGEFTTLNYKTVYKINPKYTQFTEKISNMKYAKDVGLVVETLPMYTAISSKDERWLVRYHVN